MKKLSMSLSNNKSIIMENILKQIQENINKMEELNFEKISIVIMEDKYNELVNMCNSVEWINSISSLFAKDLYKVDTLEQWYRVAYHLLKTWSNKVLFVTKDKIIELWEELLNAISLNIKPFKIINND